MEYKAILSVVVIILTLFAYVPYIVDIFKNKTKQHSFTWFTVSLTAFVAFALQVKGGAGVGAWPMLVIGLICVTVCLLSLWRGTRDIKAIDIFLFVISLVALGLWLVIDQPVLSVILITVSEILAFGPTVRKSWNAPYTETLALYEISAVRHGLAVLAVEQLNILTALYPAAWALTNVAITLILLSRRRVISSQ